MMLELCAICGHVETYRKNASRVPCCIICEIPIKKFMPKIIVHAHASDQEKKVVIR